MNIRKAVIEDCDSIIDIAVTTINETYPHYYPAGVVESYLEYHTEKAIKDDIESGILYVLEDNGVAYGTVTIKDGTIIRLFVLPSAQGKGYGNALMDFSEEMIFEEHDRVVIESSLAAKILYKKRGYVETRSHRMTTKSGDFLCYDTMEKHKDDYTCCETVERYFNNHLFYETVDIRKL